MLQLASLPGITVLCEGKLYGTVGLQKYKHYNPQFLFHIAFVHTAPSIKVAETEPGWSRYNNSWFLRWREFPRLHVIKVMAYTVMMMMIITCLSAPHRTSLQHQQIPSHLLVSLPSVLEATKPFNEAGAGQLTNWRANDSSSQLWQETNPSFETLGLFTSVDSTWKTLQLNSALTTLYRMVSIFHYLFSQ